MMRAHASQRGFTLIEVVAALAICATAIAALMFTINDGVDVATATNEARLMKMVLRYQAERFLAGEETAGSGDASSIPGLEEVKGVTWEALEREVQLLEEPPTTVREVKLVVRLEGAQRGSADTTRPENEDEPGTMSVSFFLEVPPDQQQ